MNHPSVADTPAPGAVTPAPSALPRAVWIGAGAVELTIAGIASALAWRGAPSEAAPEAAAVTPAAEVAKAPEPKPAEKLAARRPAPERAVAAAPACVGCGVVVAVEAVKQAGQATDLSAARSGPVHLFDEVATHLPERMWLTEMQVKGQALTIQGVSLDNELVALFLTAMNASPYFENVELLETQAKDVDGYKLNAFEMSATLEGSSKSEAGAGG